MLGRRLEGPVIGIRIKPPITFQVPWEAEVIYRSQKALEDVFDLR